VAICASHRHDQVSCRFGQQVAEAVVASKDNLCNASDGRSLGSSSVTAFASNENMHITQRRNRGNGLGYCVFGQLAVRNVCEKKNSH
jgi:hypothetical protein